MCHPYIESATALSDKLIYIRYAMAGYGVWLWLNFIQVAPS